MFLAYLSVYPSEKWKKKQFLVYLVDVQVKRYPKMLAFLLYFNSWRDTSHSFLHYINATWTRKRNQHFLKCFRISLSQGNVFRILFPVMGEVHSRIFRIFCYDTFKSWKITKSVSFQICFVTTMKRYMRWTKHIWYAQKIGNLMHSKLADFPITHKKNI